MKDVFVWVENETKKLSCEWLQAKQLLVIFNLLTLSRRFRCRGGRQGWPTRWGRHTCSHSYRGEYQRSSDHTSPLPRPVWPPCYGVVCMTEVSLVSSSWVYLAQPGLANNFCKLSNMSAVCCPTIFWLKLTSNTGDTNEILKLYRWQWSLVSHSIKWIVCFILFPYQNKYIYDSLGRIVLSRPCYWPKYLQVWLSAWSLPWCRDCSVLTAWSIMISCLQPFLPHPVMQSDQPDYPTDSNRSIPTKIWVSLAETFLNFNMKTFETSRNVS